MFWDKISPVYDLFEKVYNGKVYMETGNKVAELIATDYSTGMLRRASRKCRKYSNMVFKKTDIKQV